MNDSQMLIAGLSGPAVIAIRTLYSTPLPDEIRVAVLVEIAGAAATLARTVAKASNVDPAVIAGQVTDPADVKPVLGRGKWLPTLTRHVALPPRASRLAGAPRRSTRDAEQLALFASVPSEGL